MLHLNYFLRRFTIFGLKFFDHSEAVKRTLIKIARMTAMCGILGGGGDKNNSISKLQWNKNVKYTYRFISEGI